MSTNLRNVRFFGTLTAGVMTLALAVALSIAPPAEGKGKPGGGGGGGEPPAISYSYIGLGTLDAMEGETAWSEALGLNNYGDVVGLTSTSYFPRTAPFLWTAETGMVDLNALIDPAERHDPSDLNDVDGWGLRSATAINDSGQIAGTGNRFENDLPGPRRAFRLEPPATQDGDWTVEDLGNLGGSNGTKATAINSSGDVTGYSVSDIDGNYHMFLVLGDDEGAVMHDLGAYEGKPTFANSISNRTEGMIQIVGRTQFPIRALRCTCMLNENGISHGYEDLGTLMKNDSGEAQAYGINDQGEIVGSATKSQKDERAFLLGAGGMVNLGTLSTGQSWNDSCAYDLNNNGEVVGESLTVYPYLEAFYYSSATGIVNLEQAVTNLPPSLRGLITPMAINDYGVVCGPRVVNYNGYDREAFILIPNPPL